MWESYLHEEEALCQRSVTLAVNGAPAWMAQKVAGTRVLPISPVLLHTRGVSRAVTWVFLQTRSAVAEPVVASSVALLPVGWNF